MFSHWKISFSEYNTFFIYINGNKNVVGDNIFRFVVDEPFVETLYTSTESLNNLISLTKSLI
ncbi:hypothetical protein A0H76_1588 [Hepatospora eriocheir]|uniref:Uncharacterized protein n=1 Tax=Hepatospora eriocheir TaxID=1081669 RepID=A0A1X0Q5R0_9MICR|nr:hypothetical protein A0H76_1588 [Hepatospora eriocheir]